MRKRSLWFLVLLVSLQIGAMFAQEKRDKGAKHRKLDIGKMTVELPLIKRISSASSSVNFGPKKLKSGRNTKIGQEVSAFKNPAVRPGHIRWHDSFEQAQRTSLKSNKPIFIFYLLGQLNEKFT